MVKSQVGSPVGVLPWATSTCDAGIKNKLEVEGNKLTIF